MKKNKILAILIMMLMTIVVFGQTTKETKGKTNKIEAKILYDAFKQGKEDPYKKKMQISGFATFIGPDVYALPSIELSESKDGPGRVVCVLPLTDYLKLRKVSKKDHVVMEGDVRGYSNKYDIVVVKQCKIIEINGKKL